MALTVNPTEYTNFTVTVEGVLKGAFLGKELVIEMIGSADTVWFSEMPEFRVGEKHLLFLTTFDWHASTAGYRVMGPTARYKIDDGTLESTSPWPWGRSQTDWPYDRIAT